MPMQLQKMCEMSGGSTEPVRMYKYEANQPKKVV